MKIINQSQQEILSLFASVSDSEKFYLTGGTALALFYLKHRQSNDLDFFTNESEIIIPFSHHLEKELKESGMQTQRRRGMHSFVEILASKNEGSTIIHLAKDSPFRLDAVKEFPEYPKLKIDGLIDIASNKLLALFGRATLRDFIDIYFLVKKTGFTIEELSFKTKEKDPGFDSYWLGVALERINTFKDDAPEMLLLVEPVNFKEMLDFFNQWREQITKKLL